MNLKTILFNLSLSTLTFLMVSSEAGAKEWYTELYSQSVYLHKYGNPITQNMLTTGKSMRGHDLYGGVWFETDKKSDAEQTFTDAQISPLIGAKTTIFGNEWMYSRFFFNTRLVHRIKPFPDDRVRTTYEVRGGLMGYGLKLWTNPFYVENYYAFFYTRLYGDRMILQGWTRQGLRFFKHLELLNEFFIDTFDFTRGNDPTYDLRPGARLRWDFTGGSVQLLYQRLYHFSNLEFSGRNESRSTLVLGYYW